MRKSEILIMRCTTDYKKSVEKRLKKLGFKTITEYYEYLHKKDIKKEKD